LSISHAVCKSSYRMKAAQPIAPAALRKPWIELGSEMSSGYRGIRRWRVEPR
jgi:hypothetical protein